MESKNVGFMGFIGVHVGAGNHSKSRLPEYEKVCKKACKKAMEAIKLKKSALEALSIAIKILEDCPLTNAGFGSNLNLDGTVECDASIMDGELSNFGAVGAIRGVHNPIMVAKKLVEEQNTPLPSGRVQPMLLCGKGARDWAVNHGIPSVSEKSLITDDTLRSFKKYTRLAKQDNGIKERAKQNTNRNPRKRPKLDDATGQDSTCVDHELLDTVGAVCLDSYGNVCSGVSSGGLLLKYPGRIGQAAVFGSGCWSSNMTNENPVGVACSSSGCGEQLMKTLLCKECADLCTDSEFERDGIPVVQELLQSKFLGSRHLSASCEKLAGIILLRCHLEESSEGLECMNVDFTWGHTTQTMAVGYMSVEDQKPQFQLTMLGSNCSPGNSVLVQGIVRNQPCGSSQRKEATTSS